MTSRRQPATWVGVLFAGNFLLQRFSVPNLEIAMTIPFTLIWLVCAWRAGVLTVEKRRLTLWLLAGGGAGLMIVPQLLFVRVPYVSPMSWMLWMVTWVPVAFHLRERGRDAYQQTLRVITRIGVAIAGLSVVFMGAQLAGWEYRDVLTDVVPAPLLMHEYVITYPIEYGSELYKSNAFLALEPSFLSFTLALCILAALMSGSRMITVAFLGLGMLATSAFSGVTVLVVAVIAMIVRKQFAMLRPYALWTSILVGISALTPFGASLLARVGEGSDARSSVSLRATEPYLFLWPRWIDQPAGVLFGQGAGSSQWLISGTGVLGLLLPSVAKVLFDYGLIGGVLLVALLVVTFVRSPAPAVAFALAVSMLTVQSASQPLLVCCVAMITLWSPTSQLSEEPRDLLEPGPGVKSPERGPTATVTELTPQRL